MVVTYDDKNLGRDTKVFFNSKNLGYIYSIGDTKASRSSIDITPYGSDFKVFTVGTADPGTLDLELGESTLEQNNLWEIFLNHEKGRLKIAFPSGNEIECDALILSYGKSVKIDDVVRTPVTLQLSGKPNLTNSVAIQGVNILERGTGAKLNANCPVVWSIISETTDPTTTVEDGFVIFGKNETATKLLIKAVSHDGSENIHEITAAHEPLRIMPDRKVMKRGDSFGFSATQPIRSWSIETTHISDTKFERNILHISENETSEGLWIRCESQYDDEAFAFIKIER